MSAHSRISLFRPVLDSLGSTNLAQMRVSFAITFCSQLDEGFATGAGKDTGGIGSRQYLA
jgi:hypothetical protein